MFTPSSDAGHDHLTFGSSEKKPLKGTEIQICTFVKILECYLTPSSLVYLMLTPSPDAGHDHLTFDSSEKKPMKGTDTQICNISKT
jgi:hypothetical protein